MKTQQEKLQQISIDQQQMDYLCQIFNGEPVQSINDHIILTFGAISRLRGDITCQCKKKFKSYPTIKTHLKKHPQIKYFYYKDQRVYIDQQNKKGRPPKSSKQNKNNQFRILNEKQDQFKYDICCLFENDGMDEFNHLRYKTIIEYASNSLSTQKISHFQNDFSKISLFYKEFFELLIKLNQKFISKSMPDIFDPMNNIMMMKDLVDDCSLFELYKFKKQEYFQDYLNAFKKNFSNKFIERIYFDSVLILWLVRQLEKQIFSEYFFLMLVNLQQQSKKPQYLLDQASKIEEQLINAISQPSKSAQQTSDSSNNPVNDIHQPFLSDPHLLLYQNPFDLTKSQNRQKFLQYRYQFLKVLGFR